MAQSVTVRLDDAVNSRLESLARATKRPAAQLAAEVIAAYVDRAARHVEDIEAGLADLEAGRVVSEEEAAERFDRLAG